MSDEALKVCPECQGKLTKILYPTGVIFKGSGFYSTDYKSTGNGSSSEAGAETKSDSKSEAKTESKGESKSESKSDSKPQAKSDSKPAPKSESKSGSGD